MPLSPASGTPAPATPRGERRVVVVLLVLAALLLVATAVVYDWVTEGEKLASVDVPVLHWFAAHRTAALDAVLVTVSVIGSTPVLTPVLAALVGALCWFRRTLWPLLVLLVAAACSVLTTVVLKPALDRPRPPRELAIPPYETSGSFPSGHTLNSTALGLVLIYLVLRWATAVWVRRVLLLLALLYPLLMGVSRVYMGAHWVTDVVAGWLLGVAWAAVIICLDRCFLSRAWVRSD